MEQAAIWKTGVKQAFTGFLVFTLCGIIKGFVKYFAFAGAAASLMSGSVGGAVAPKIIVILLNICIIVGFVYYLMGIKKMQQGAPEADQPAVKQLFLGALLGIIGFGVDFIPLLGWAATILEILSFIFMMIGFNKMKKSVTLPAEAVSGSNKLFIAMLLALIGAGLCLIPLLGSLLNGILGILVLVFGFLGWKAMANSQLNA